MTSAAPQHTGTTPSVAAPTRQTPGKRASDEISADLTAPLTGAISRWDESVTCLVALALATDPDTPVAVAASARAVLAAAGVSDALNSEGLPFSPQQLHGIVISPLLQAAERVTVRDAGWSSSGDTTLIAQGQGSGAAVALFTRFVLPHVGDLADRLARPGARMIDVGTGIAALALGFAQAFPSLWVTGLDVLPRALDLARSQLDSRPEAARIELRHQDVAALTDQSCYDLAWIPAPFIPEPAFSQGVARLVDALRPDGLLMIGHGRDDGTDLEAAVTRFKTIAYGGTPLDGPSAVVLLARHGLTHTRTIPTPPGAPLISIGRKPVGNARPVEGRPV